MKCTKLLLFILLYLLLGVQLFVVDSVKSNEKSPDNALVWSLAGTFVPSVLSVPFIIRDDPESNWNETVAISMLSAGLLVGPGLGHLYSENYGRLKGGMIARAIGGGLFLSGINKKESLFDNDDSAEILIISGSAIVLISAIIDISKSGESARKFNSEHGHTQLNVFPSYNAESSNVMLNVSLRF